MDCGSAPLAYSGSSGMLHLMHSSESSTNESVAKMVSPRGSGQGHHHGSSSPGGNVAAGLEEAVVVAGLAHHNAVGTSSPVNLKRTFYPTLFEATEDAGDEEGGDELGQPAEKKRRLTAEQVRSLEKNFEMENKLEPERKMQLARDLSLQPRQVAVWFQNRRARWKTKQLEKDYELLKADYDALKGDYTALVEEKDKLVAEVKRLNGVKSSPIAAAAGAVGLGDSKANVFSEKSKKAVKLASEHQSDPPVTSLKAVAPTDAVSVAPPKAMPSLPHAAKPALITSELLAISVEEMNAKDLQLSPTSVSNFPGGNSNSRDSKCKSGSYLGGGSPHSGSSSDTNSVNSDISNVDSPHPPIDSSFSPGPPKFLPMLQQHNSTANNDLMAGASVSTWSSTVACAGSIGAAGAAGYATPPPTAASPCSSLSSLNVDLCFSTPGTPAQACMLPGIDSPFEGLADDFCNQKMLHPGYGAQRPLVKVEEGCGLPLHPDDLPTYIFNMEDQGALPWWDWP